MHQRHSGNDRDQPHPRKYTVDQLEFLRKGYKTMRVQPLTDAFNARFDTKKTYKAIASALKKNGIMQGRMRRGKGTGTCRVYTPEQLAWLCENYPGQSHAGLAAAFNAQFGADKTAEHIKRFLANRRLNTGRTGYYETGHTPWNQGKKGYMGANATSFKKGNMPHNHTRLWSERIDSKDGYVYISVPETNPHTGFPSRYKQKHVWLWEYLNGPVPKGHCVMFADGDKYNFAPDNLILVNRCELLHLNLHHYKDAPGELKPTILAMAKLEAKAGFRSTGRHPNAGRKKKVS